MLTMRATQIAALNQSLDEEFRMRLFAYASNLMKKNGAKTNRLAISRKL